MSKFNRVATSVYGVEIYGNCCQTYINKLMELNNKILRILQNAPRDTKVVHFYNNFNTLTLPNLHKFNILLFVNKFFHRRHQLPQFFHHILPKNTDLHNYNTRSKNDLHLLSFSTTIGQRSIKYKGSQLWCSLPEYLKHITFTSSFKLKSKKYLQSVNY